MQILLVDDHALIREGIALVMQQLGDDVSISEAENGKSALEIAESSTDLDLVLLDLNLPDNSDFSLLQQLRQTLPTTPIAMLSAEEDAALIQEALQIGANGFIPKSSSSQVMIQAVQLILAGGLYLPPQIMLNMKDSAPSTAESNSNSGQPESQPAKGNTEDTDLQFTQRQTEVLMLLDQGLSNKEIARKLDMSPSTVKVHVAAILRICDAANRTQAVSLARQLGIIP